MALYDFHCESCGEIVEADFPLGKAPKKVSCKCGGEAPRYFGNVGVIFKGSGWPSQTMKRKAEGTEKNEAAGRRMRKSHKAPKLIDQR
jgi:putative FmdB family regulatory protein